MGKMTFILGGARSGKSTYAQWLANKHGGSVLFIATAEASDDEMAVRIAKHQLERPPNWSVREIPQDIAAHLKADPARVDIIILDCITLLISNLLLQAGGTAPEDTKTRALVEAEISGLMEFIKKDPADWIIVSNEAGLGVVPAYPLGRMFRDRLGHANQLLAAYADEVLWMIAGIPMPIQQFRQEAIKFD